MIYFLRFNKKLHLLVSKKRRFKANRSYLNFLNNQGQPINRIIVDSSRELGFNLLLLLICKYLKEKVTLILISVAATKESIYSIRKPIKISKKKRDSFPNSISLKNEEYYSFYPKQILFLFKRLNFHEFNPYFEGAHQQVDRLYSRFPLSDEHITNLKDYKTKFIELSDYIPCKFSKIKRGVLFAIPQFYEQGFMPLNESKIWVEKMIKIIKSNHNDSEINFSLHPRMKPKNYLDIIPKYHQNNLETIINQYKFFYSINSSTIHLAIKANCICRAFKFSFLDYSQFNKYIENSQLQLINLHD